MKFIANKRGYFADRLRNEGGIVEIDDKWLAEYKKTHGRAFECSWLDPVEAPEEKPKRAKAVKLDEPEQLAEE